MDRNVISGFLDIIQANEESEIQRNLGGPAKQLSYLMGVEVVLKVIRDGRKNLSPYFGCQIELRGVDYEG